MTERRGLPYDPREIRERLQAQILPLLSSLGIADRPKGGLVTPRNPTRNDRHPGSFVIWTAPQAAGAWRDYATDEAGDVYELIVYLKGLKAWIDAYNWALGWLGLDRGAVRSAEQSQLDRQRAERERKATEAKAEADQREKSSRLFRFWLSLPPIGGTVAETYLRETRRIPLHRLAKPPGALRFAAELEHVDRDTGEVSVWPAMVSAMTAGDKVTGLHRTWLAPDGAGKAPVPKPKKMIGATAGAAIRLSAGPSGFSPSKAAAAGKLGPLAIGEGIETCLTVAAARPDYRAWAAGSLAHMAKLEWPDCASAIVLLAENDWSPEARKAFDACVAHWERQAQGRPVAVVASEVGSDFNDWAMRDPE